jgi:hypothetical protein
MMIALPFSAMWIRQGGTWLTNRTTRADGSNDTGVVDLGYHHAAGLDFTWADRYVKTNGDDSADGTNWATAFLTITKALAVAQEGTRIHLASGNYGSATETFPLSMTNYGIQLLGTNATNTTLNGSSSATTVLKGYGVAGDGALENLSIINGYSSVSVNGVGLYLYGCSLRITGCVITNNKALVANLQAIKGGGVYAEQSSVLLSNCIVRANSARGGNADAWGGGLYLKGGRWTIIDSEISRNVAYSAGISYYAYGAGLYSDTAECRLWNCLVTKNDVSGTGSQAGGLYVNGNMAIENCTIATNTGEGLWRAGGR